MTRRLLLSAVALAAILLAVLARPARAEAEPPARGDARARWEKLTPEERQELRERHEKWKALPPDEKARLRDRL